MKSLIYIIAGMLLLSPISGELFRITFMGFDLLPSDVLIFLFLAVWSTDKIRNDCVLRIGKIGKMIIIFLFVMILSYLINFYRFDAGEMTSAFSYLGRFALYLLLPLVFFDLLERDGNKVFFKLLLSSVAFSMLAISILGFLQLKYFPSFLDLGMDVFGWDPHIGRLLSTWFDPNFAGGFIAFGLSAFISVCLFYFYKKKTDGIFWILAVIVLVSLIALYLTYSRSSYLALIASLGILALLKSRKLLLVILLAVLIGFTFSARVQGRALDAVDSGKAIMGFDSQRPLDPTARLRVSSWQYAREIIADYPWIGVGYNRYAFEINNRGYGLLSDHASGGSDSSLLTIWATTGILGLFSYLGIGFTAFAIALKRLWKKDDLQSYLDAGFFAGFAGMMIHSFFVNSLLFPLIMVYMMAGLAVMDEK